MFSKKTIFKKAIKNLAKDLKEKIKAYSYKNTLPKNPIHDDIYIVEFPKSGVTWLQHILANIELSILNKNEIVTFYNHHKYSPDIHQLKGAQINRFLERTFIKSHAEYNPYYYFVIYLLRNPFDVMVSYYNLMLGHGYNGSFEDFVKDDKIGIISWKRHINSWWYKKLSAQRIHLVKYENLLANTYEEIQNIYKNIGLSLDDEIINQAIKNSNISKMKDFENHYKRFNPNYFLDFVGKDGKKKKQEIMTDEIKQYIQRVCEKEIKEFYSELL